MVIVVERAGRLLVIQRAPEILAGGAWCFVGGAIEPGETQPEAAIREFREEVDGTIRPLRKIWQSDQPTLRLHWWLAELLDESLSANPAEVAAIRWCTRAEMRALDGLLATNREFLDRFPDDGLYQ